MGAGGDGGAGVVVSLDPASDALRHSRVLAAVRLEFPVVRAARQTQNEIPHPHVIELSTAFTALSVWDATDLVPLVAVYSDVARKLAGAAGVFSSVEHYLGITAKSYPNLSHDDRLIMPILLTGLLNNIVTLLDDASTAMGLEDLPLEKMEEIFGPRP
jgi:hypothetical protein